MVDAYSPYTAIVARPWLHAMGVVSSTLHFKVKYPSGDQVEELIESQSMARQCLVAAIGISLKVNHWPLQRETYSNQGKQYCPLMWWQKGQSVKSQKKTVVDNDEKIFFQVGVQLPPQEKEELVVFLKKNVDVFALSAYEAPRWI